MITTDFRTLPFIQHWIKPSTNLPGDAGSVDQCPETIGTIACAVDLMNTIEAMHDGYMREAGEWLKLLAADFARANVSVAGRMPASLDGRVDPRVVAEFRNRETILINAYVVQSSGLLRMLGREYELVSDVLRHIAPAQAPSKEALRKTVCERDDEWRHFRLVRNKVSAHAAFARPEPGDDLAMELTSLLVYTGSDFRIDRKGLILGESQIQMSGSIAAHVFGVANPRLPPISLHSLSTALAEHLPAWYRMFEELLDAVANVPREVVLAAKPDLAQIYVHRGAQAVEWHRSI
ncbi:MAG: hypothetical protein ACLQBL_03570 [Polyangiaceae bacterium]